MIENPISGLIIKFLAGDISIDEMAALQEMLSASQANQQLFSDLKNSWTTASLYSLEEKQLDTNKSWENTKSRIGSVATGNKTKHIILRKILQNAALWLLLVSLGSFVTWVTMRHRTPQPLKSTCEINTPLGSRSHTILPDGSEVWLNAGTTLRYPVSFSENQRDVFLTGEAYFKVTTNKKWPFVVHTTDVKIKALGTVFNVKAYPNDKAVVATLVEGTIKVENENGSKKVFTYTLKPKEKLTFLKAPEPQKGSSKSKEPNATENTAEKTQNNIEVNENTNTILSTSWKDPRWVVDGEQIDNFAIALERRYGVKINVLSAELSHYKFTGTIENETLEQVLKYLRLTIPIKYVVQKGYVDLTINDALKENYTNYLKKAN